MSKSKKCHCNHELSSTSVEGHGCGCGQPINYYWKEKLHVAHFLNE